jgi:AcrR family transcriptional regulator
MKMLDVAVKASPEDTRSRILAAAREIFALKGTRGTTTREVADRAGVNEATLFRHFGTKQAPAVLRVA